VPTYVYACTECDHRFEAQQAFSDASLTECPNCGGKLRKVFNSVGIVFKGSGFYRNDSRDKKTTADSGASASSDSSTGSADKSSSSSDKSASSTDKSSGNSSSKPATAPASSSPSTSSSSSTSAGSAA
jgi:putative FmdB family regulatory protein